MTFPLLSCAEVREREGRAIRELGLPSIVLMENAGRGAAELLLSLGIAGKVVILCGKGNNGGDGLVMARWLDNWRIPIRVILFADPNELSPDSAINHRILTGSGVVVEARPGEWIDRDRLRLDLATADWIVDALFGTGLKGPLKAPFEAIISLINDAPAKTLAVDIPSGLDADNGVPLGPTVRADRTATFIAWKSGFVREAAGEWLGQVHLIDVGLPRNCIG
jgi:NAD(P)H-hydrate epimerase